MTVIATLELRFDPAKIDEARTVFTRVLAETRAFDGNLGVDVLVDTHDPAHWIAYETWQSPEHDAAYREFRAGPGAIAEMPALLAGRPVLTWFEVDDSI